MSSTSCSRYLMLLTAWIIILLPNFCCSDDSGQIQSSNIRKSMNNSLNEAASSIIDSSVKNLSGAIMNATNGAENKKSPIRRKKAKKPAKSQEAVASQEERNVKKTGGGKDPDISIITKEEAENEMSAQRRKKIIVD